MPGWHEATADLREQGKLRTIGIVEEQHPDRARLFMQWKRLDWPLMVDSLDLLGLSVVPVTLFVDEHGIVRAIQPRPADAAAFAQARFEPPEGDAAAVTTVPDASRLKAEAVRSGAADAWRRYAEVLLLWGGRGRLSEAVDAFRRAAAVDPDDGWARFRLGVALRARYDSPTRQQGDFRTAVQAWSAALENDPNNYIWRRRIQQYGPRQDKPYPFYDWIAEARDEILARGDTPVALAVEPRGAELAEPASEFVTWAEKAGEPDPRGRVERDRGRFVAVETTVVPPAIAPGHAARVHLVFRPRVDSGAHWNNEAGDLLVWLEPPEGWQVQPRLLRVARAAQRVSVEPRTVEAELRTPEDIGPGEATIPGYALYYVCEDADGACLYRRRDLDLRIRVSSAGE